MAMWILLHGRTDFAMTIIAEIPIIPYAGTTLLVLAGLLVAAVVLRRQLPAFQRLGPDLPMISRSMGGLQEWRDATRLGGLAVERGIAAVAIGSAGGVFLLFADSWVIPAWVLVFLVLGAMAAVGFTSWFTFQALHFGRKALVSRQRFLGKRMVHEALNELVTEKYMIIEDMTLDGLPLDHVVIGPSGVFLLETQTVMQNRSRFESGDAFQASFDGRSMMFRRRRINAPLDSVRKKCGKLTEWVFEKVGEEIEIKPILVVPGWRIERFGQGMVRVANQVELPEVIRAAADEEVFRENLGVRIKTSLKELQTDSAQVEPEVEVEEGKEEGITSKRWWPLKSRSRKRASVRA
ncbi:MAG: hypothetical protein DRP71_11510 [Verrucomicrobia bacterium]|nr:MAG: hypothetical protein DRP71_11510 [Verrucomicrobiota bacterium]